MIKIHDSFFKKSFERPEIAREFLRNYLPKDVKKVFDIKTMKICKDSFIESDLHARQVDILFENEKNQYIILLLEHQSSNDDFMPYRLLKYNVSIWDRFLKNSSSKSSPSENSSQNKKKLPLIFNTVFYNGPKAFNSPRTMFDLMENRDLAKKYLFKYELINAKSISVMDMQLQRKAGLMQYLMKNIYAKDLYLVWQKAKRFFNLNSFNLDYLTSALCYTVNKIKRKDRDKLFKLIEKSTSKEKGEKIMRSIAEAWKEEGFEEGIEKGKLAGIQEGIEKGIEKEKFIIAKNMLIKGYLSKEIADMTGLTIQEVENLRKN